ncbi:MAG: hypothetical protein AAF203_07050, partial [Pseudomonadota bacterium]
MRRLFFTLFVAPFLPYIGKEGTEMLKFFLKFGLIVQLSLSCLTISAPLYLLADDPLAEQPQAMDDLMAELGDRAGCGVARGLAAGGNGAE